MRVLVIDDEIVIRRLLKVMLEHLNCEVVMAANVQEGLDLLQHRPIDVITCELQMPFANGLDLLRRIRNDPAYHRLPVIVLTAAGFENETAPALLAGASAILRKPFTSRQIETVLDKVVQHSLMNA